MPRICAECGRTLTEPEEARLATDIDFVEHHGHLIRAWNPVRSDPFTAEEIADKRRYDATHIETEARWMATLDAVAGKARATDRIVEVFRGKRRMDVEARATEIAEQVAQILMTEELMV